MKFLATIIFLLVGQLLFGQSSSDTCLTRDQFTSLKYKLYFESDKKNDLVLKIRLLTELKRIDTLVNTKDSVITSYLNKTDSIFRTVKRYYKGDCLRDSMVIHYNKYGLTEYLENWVTDCNADTTDKENTITTYKNSYSRYEYDNANRVIKYVFHISTPLTRRIILSYDSSGKQTRRTDRISHSEFWD